MYLQVKVGCLAYCQDHYDWGMRAVKSVLVVAGKLKRAEPGLPEDSLLMRALRDFNTPKIVHSDEVRTNVWSMLHNTIAIANVASGASN